MRQQSLVKPQHRQPPAKGSGDTLHTASGAQSLAVNSRRRKAPPVTRPAPVPDQPDLEIVSYPMSSIRPYAANPRLNDHAVDSMVQAIKHYGFIVPIILREAATGKAEIVDGHLRYKAMQALGRKEIPAVLVSLSASETYVRGLRVSINRMAETADWDEDKLAAELHELEAAGVTNLEEATGFAAEEVKALLELVELPDEEETQRDTKDRSTVLVPSPDTDYLGVGQFQLPGLRLDRILDMPAPSTWAGTGLTNGPPPYIYNFSCDSTVGLNWKQAVIGFYTADHKFEIIWKEPDEYVRRFLERGAKQAITPNWSVFAFWPFARRLFNVFRSRWVGRYMQEAGMDIIPDLCCAVQDLDWAFDGLPGGCPLSIQLQGKYTKRELRDETKIIETILDFHPARLWVYAPKRKLDLFPLLKKRLSFPIEVIEPRLTVRKQLLEGF